MTQSNGNIFRVTGPLCEEFTGHRWIPTQRPVTRSFDVYFDLRLNKLLSKESWGWWFETPSCSLWCHCNVIIGTQHLCWCLYTESPCVFYSWVLRPHNLQKNEIFDSETIGPPNSKNHNHNSKNRNHIQTITPFASFAYDHLLIFNIMY